jgi:diadenosine tetraphosphate (Ap4A) HIT family hydrolase
VEQPSQAQDLDGSVGEPLSPCTFCAEFRGETEGNLYRLYCGLTDAPSRIVARKHDLVALPSIGQMVDGYMLVCSLSHHTSFSSYCADGMRASNLESFLATVQLRIGEIYGQPTVVFEHGPGVLECHFGCGVSHAHLHVVPGQVDLMPWLRRHGMVWRHCASVVDAVTTSAAKDGYLLYSDERGTWLHEVNSALPSQYLRRALAAVLGLGEEWDWRRSPHPERVAKVLTAFGVQPVSRAESVGNRCRE